MAGCVLSEGNKYLVVFGNKPLSVMILHASTGQTYKIVKHDSYFDVDFVHNTIFASSSTAIIAYQRGSKTYITRMAIASKTVWEASISASHVAGVCEPRAKDNRVYIMGSSRVSGYSFYVMQSEYDSPRKEKLIVGKTGEDEEVALKPTHTDCTLGTGNSPRISICFDNRLEPSYERYA